MGQNYIIAIDSGHESLYHHGIKGQKWGIRRFQNEDGSLTDAGMKRYYTKSGYQTIGKMRKEYRDVKKTLRNESISNRDYMQSKKVAKAALKSKIADAGRKTTGHEMVKNYLLGRGGKTSIDSATNTAAFMLGRKTVYKVLGYGEGGKRHATYDDAFNSINSATKKKVDSFDKKIQKMEEKKDFDVKSFDAITEDMKYKNGKTFYSVADAKRDQQITSDRYDKQLDKLRQKRDKYSSRIN